MKMKKVLVTIPVTEKHQDMLENISASLTFTYSGEEEVTPKMVRDANIILEMYLPPISAPRKSLNFCSAVRPAWACMSCREWFRRIRFCAIPPVHTDLPFRSI